MRVQLVLWSVVVLVMTAACAGSTTPAGGEHRGEAMSTTTGPNTTAETSTTTATLTATSMLEPEVAWTEADAERDAANYLAALAAEEYDVAAWSADNNGIVLDERELPVETLERLCADGACAGPYRVVADGPGLVDPDSGQASSTVTVTHLPSGTKGTMFLGTFEGQLIIADLPPLIPSAGGPSLVESLFGDDIPDRVVVERFDGFEIWDHGAVDWVTNWVADHTTDLAGDVIVADGEARSLTRPTFVYGPVCGDLLSRAGQIVVMDCEKGLVLVETREPAIAPAHLEDLDDGQYEWFDERGGTVIEGISDAEGNATSIHTSDGLDLLGDDSAGYTVLSTGGDLFAYTEHREPAAYSHFSSSLVVVRSTTDGREVARVVLERAVVGLQLTDAWLLAWLAPEERVADGPRLASIAAIDLDTGEVSIVDSATRVFLP